MKNMLRQERKVKKVALYTPYLDVLGGGELHVLLILKVLEEFGFEPFIFWDKDLKEEIKNKFGLSFKNLKFLPNIFKKGSLLRNAFWLRKFDVFIYVPDGSYFFSLAKKNFLFCMVPNKKLYKGFFNRIKLFNWKIVANSKFTAGYISKILKKQVYVLYPALNSDVLNLEVDFSKKEDFILNIGRFFKQLHSKKQDILIKSFIKIKQKNKLLNKFELILVGGLKNEDKDYFESLKKMIKGRNDIKIYKNLSRKDVLELLRKTKFYWHFAGYGESEPYKMEHLGISILEAMAAGAIVFSYRAGGPIELIKEGKNGFLFKNLLELEDKFLKVIKNRPLQKRIFENARFFAKQKFSFKKFKERVKEVFL